MEQQQWPEDIAFALNRQITREDIHKRAQARSKRKTPPRLDLSRLFNRRKSSQNSVTGPSSAKTPRSVPFVEESTDQHTPQWARHRPGSLSKESPLSPRQMPALSPRAVDDIPSPNMNAKRPPAGMQHWFDGLESADAQPSDYVRENRYTESKRLNVDKPLPQCPRDTFLSMSTARTNSVVAGSRDVNVRSPNLSHQAGTASHQAPSCSNNDRVPPSSSSGNSQAKSSASIRTAARRKQPRRHKSPPKRQHDPDSSFQGHSVLVLSDPEDSDDLMDDDSGITTQVASINGSIHNANIGTMYAVQSPKSIRAPPAALDSATDAVGYISSTSAASSSPESDGGTFQEGSETSSPHSKSQGSMSCCQPWLSDSTSSVMPSPQTDDQRPSQPGPEWRDSISLRQSDVSGRATPPMQRITNAFRDNPTRTHQLMAVTAEEAHLLATMRARRAAEQTKMFPSPNSAGEASPRSRAERGISRPSARVSKLHASTVFTDISDSAPLEEMASDAALLSPARDFRDSVNGSATPRVRSNSFGKLERAGRPSTAVVDCVWEDVQAWRKHTGLSRSKSISRLQPGKRDSQSSARPAMPKGWNSDPAQRGSRHRHGRSDSGSVFGLDTGTFSMGNVDGSVAGDVLAAWGDLGGLKRSDLPRSAVR